MQKYNKAKSFHLSYGTIYKMLQSIFPRKNKRMVCVDEYLVDAGEVIPLNYVPYETSAKGWDRLKSYINALGRMGYLLSTEETDLERRVKLSRSFLEGELILMFYLLSLAFHRFLPFSYRIDQQCS